MKIRHRISRRKFVRRWLPVPILAAALPCGCTKTSEKSTALNKPRTDSKIELPAANKKGGTSAAEVFAQRRSVRKFTDEQLTEVELSQLLWATQGSTNDLGYRTAPSAGALYPLELYLAMAAGFYHYEPDKHTLSQRLAEDVRPALHQAAGAQDAVGEAPAVFILTAIYQRTAQKYGQPRSRRYVHMEAGHAGQNLLLQATALGLGAVPIGAFEDYRVSKVLSLPRNEAPLYLIPVGHAR